jgi:Family of unknown function (DUF6159)
MFDRLSRSWNLVKASAAVLSQDKELLVFPLISSLATALVLAAFALPLLGLGALDGLSGGRGGVVSTGVYVVAFLFYLAQYFVIFFFNTALVGAAMIRLNGGDPTVKDGLAIATSRIGSIFGYALIAATVGVVLRAIQERVGFLGRIIVGLIGAGWTIATFLVVPVLAARDVGPVEAIKESASLLKKSWGENLIGQAGMGVAFSIIYLAAALLSVILIIAAATTKIAALIAIAVICVVIGILLLALVHAALAGIYSAALYRYATAGEGSAHFDKGALQAAFAAK